MIDGTGGDGATAAEGPLADDVADELPWREGDLVGGRYRISGVLGTGGMGAVYAAEHLETRRPVAIKALRPEIARSKKAEARLMREARLVGRIRHRNIVDVFDVGKQDGVPFLVMEKLEGFSLDVMIRRGPVSVVDAVSLLAPAMRGVAAAHEAGVVHRDLKPENIFLCLDEERRVREVKVLDFGVSKTYEDALGETQLTRSGTVVGTPRYMAPEQLTSEPVDARADVYALAMILYELVSGRVPFEGDTFALLAAAKLHQAPTPLLHHAPEAPAAFEAVLARALSRDPAKRPSSIAAFAEQLAPFADGADFHSALIPLPDPTGARRRLGTASAERALTPPARGRRVVPIVVLAALLAGSLAALGFFLLGRAREAPPAAEAATPAALEDEGVERAGVPVDPSAAGEAASGAEEETAAPAEDARPDDGAEAEPPPEREEATAPAERPTIRPRRSPSRGRTGTLSWDDF